MARKRTISPEIWEDEKFGSLTTLEKLLFIGLITLADDEGRGIADISYIKSKLLPYNDNIRTADVMKALTKISTLTSTILYKVNGRKYFAIGNWTKWQSVDKPSPSVIHPPPNLGVGGDIQKNIEFGDNSGKSRGTFGEQSAKEIKEKEKKQKNKENKEKNTHLYIYTRACEKENVCNNAVNVGNNSVFVCNNEVNDYNNSVNDYNNLINVDKNSIIVGRNKKTPTLSEIEEYAQSIGCPVNVEKFFNYYESNGWTINGEPMTNWQARLNLWWYGDKEKVKETNKQNAYIQRDYEKETLNELFNEDDEDI